MGSSQSCPKQKECPKCHIMLSKDTKIEEIIYPILKYYTPKDLDLYDRIIDQGDTKEKSFLRSSLNSYVVTEVNKTRKMMADKEENTSTSGASGASASGASASGATTNTVEKFGIDRNLELILLVLFLLYVFMRK
jgi:hypothetical protein